MHIKLAEFVKQRPEQAELQKILRSCVHCGFCNSACPTYQLLGDERDGPRGRIYLLKQALEGASVSSLSQQHLDRCLHCQACESACPSGVQYGRLLDLGRKIIEERSPRSWRERFQRRAIVTAFAYRRRFTVLLKLMRRIKPYLPLSLSSKIPTAATAPGIWPEPRHSRRMLIFPGCVQAGVAPQIDILAARILDRLGISLIAIGSSGCCGALPYHLEDYDLSLRFARANIDACWTYVVQGAEAIVATASGCALMLKNYQALLQYDVEYANKAAKLSELTKDIGEILHRENLSQFMQKRTAEVAFQAPCTLQHGQKINGVVENILRQAGYCVHDVADAQLCCGSAGVYSWLQPKIAKQLRSNKLLNLQKTNPDLIATANIGCLLHLQAASALPVKHWLELLIED